MICLRCKKTITRYPCPHCRFDGGEALYGGRTGDL